MSVVDRQSIIQITSSIQIENAQKKQRPEILSKLKPKVEAFVSETVTLKQSEAEVNMSKLVKFIRKQEALKKTIKDIKEKNTTIKATTEDIDKKLDQIAPAAEALEHAPLDAVSLTHSQLFRPRLLRNSERPRHHMP